MHGHSISNTVLYNTIDQSLSLFINPHFLELIFPRTHFEYEIFNFFQIFNHQFHNFYQDLLKF